MMSVDLEKGGRICIGEQMLFPKCSLLSRVSF
jgi:hypothetical protein